MIPFDFIYCRPDTLAEAYEIFSGLRVDGKNPVYYAGGSEIITLCRSGSIKPGAVIDIKSIPECTQIFQDQETLHIGAACTLNQIKESKLFPLLALSCGRIADHTNQCRITLGGNLCGSIIYRETSLPLLLSDAKITVFGRRGLRTMSFQSVFDGRMQLSPSELIVQIDIPEWALKAPYFHVKHTTNEKIDYPLVSMAAIRQNRYLRAAFSGVCSYPFRSELIDTVLNDSSMPYAERAERAAGLLPEPVYHDVEGAGDYRTFVFQNTLNALLEAVSDGKI